MDKIHKISIGNIKVKQNFRRQVGDVSDLMDSIKENGLLQPIGLRKAGTKYEVVFGNRRLAAMKKLGRKTVPAVVIGKDVNKTVANIVENLQRDNVSLYEVGRGIHELMTKDKLSKSEVTSRLSTNKSFVNKALDAYECTPQKFRHKVVSMDASTKGNKRGKISSAVSSTINATAKRFGLTDKQIEEFYDYASRQELSNSKVRIISHLLSEGATFKAALRQSDDVKLVRSEVMIRKDEDERLTQKYGKAYVRTIFEGQKMEKIKKIRKK